MAKEKYPTSTKTSNLIPRRICPAKLPHENESSLNSPPNALSVSKGLALAQSKAKLATPVTVKHSRNTSNTSEEESKKQQESLFFLQKSILCTFIMKYSICNCHLLLLGIEFLHALLPGSKHIRSKTCRLYRVSSFLGGFKACCAAFGRGAIHARHLVELLQIQWPSDSS